MSWEVPTMQSATSYFNRALFRKNLQRFWPLWAGYTLIWLLLLPLPLLTDLADRSIHDAHNIRHAARYLLNLGAYGGLAMAAVFGIFFAMALFGYLTSPRATQGFHSMPVRRETLYATNYLTGLVCMVSALALAFSLAGVITACFGALDAAALGTALLAAVLAVLFFYSFGVLCMIFTGQILAAPVFYGILNFLVVAMEYLVRTFAGNFLFGFDGNVGTQPLDFLSPVYMLVCTLDVVSDEYVGNGVYAPLDHVRLEGLWLLGVYAAVGIVFALLGLLLYRRRASEASGSTVTVPWARPIFKYGVALCAAFSLGQLIYFLIFGMNLSNGAYSLAGTIICMLFAGLLGYFAAEMLLQKSFRVWRTGRAGALVFSVVLVCFGFAMSLDLTGYERYFPETDKIKSISVNIDAYGDSFHGMLTEPESIQAALDAHRALVNDKERQLSLDGPSFMWTEEGRADYSYLYFRVTYILRDGRRIVRDYNDCRAYAAEEHETGSVAQTMTALLNCPEVSRERVLGALPDDGSCTFTGGYYNVYDERLSSLSELEVYPLSTDGELTAAQARTLEAALRRDYAAGRADGASLFRGSRDSGFYVELELWYVRKDDGKTVNTVTANSYGEVTEPSNASSINVVVTANLTDTVQALADMGLLPLPFGAAAVR